MPAVSAQTLPLTVTTAAAMQYGRLSTSLDCHVSVSVRLSPRALAALKHAIAAAAVDSSGSDGLTLNIISGPVLQHSPGSSADAAAADIAVQMSRQQTAARQLTSFNQTPAVALLLVSRSAVQHSASPGYQRS